MMSVVSPLPVLSQEEILERLNSIEKLPTLPLIVTKIIDTLGNPESSVKDLASIIRIDQSISMQILKVANSAYYGFRSRVTVLDRAIMILGFEEIKRIAMSVYVIKSIPFKIKDKFFKFEDFWYHSLGVAYCSRIIAEHIGEKRLDEAYTAGLLHDIGKIIIGQFFQRYFVVIVHYSQNIKNGFADLESEILGCDHSVIGSWLATIWDLPKMLRDAIGGHHSIMDSSELIGDESITRIVSLADVLVKRNRIGIVCDVPQKIPPILLESLNIDKEMLSQIVDSLGEAKSAIYSYLG